MKCALCPCKSKRTKSGGLSNGYVLGEKNRFVCFGCIKKVAGHFVNDAEIEGL